MAAEGWPYFKVASTMTRFVEALRRGVPNGDLTSWLTAAVGVTRSVAAGELSTLRRLGWLDGDVVTERGRSLRGDRASEAAAATLQACYPELLQVTERAPDAPEPALEAWLQTNSALGELVIGRVVRTFMALRQVAQTGMLPDTPVRTRRAGSASTPAGSHPTHRTSPGRLPRAEAGDREPMEPEGSSGAPEPHTSTSLTPSIQEIVFPLQGGGVVRIITPRTLQAEDIRRIHGLVDLLLVQGADGHG